jgi:MFS family permease
MLIVAALGVLIESGFTPAAFAHIADITDGRQSSRGMAMGVYSFLLGAGQLVGAGLGAPFAARWRMDGVLACTALLALVALGGVAGMRRPQEP